MRRLFAVLMIGLLCSAAEAQAAIETGTELGTPFQFAANSTNFLNYNQLTPGRVGQVAPYVVLSSATNNSVTLDFNNGAAGLAFFEIRIDGIATGVNPHPVVTGDTIHTGGVAVNSGVTGLLRSFTANSLVEVRLALGGERDWDFNWTAFPVEAEAAVPEPITLAVWGVLGLSGSVIAWRTKKKQLTA